ncbi:hypothetical protein [Croceimicrobium sp.]|uniref:hypothetical protein n=1 Tax=Croceimicrobium sp. TaxID=2828340 RepID=UPI003BAD3689
MSDFDVMKVVISVMIGEFLGRATYSITMPIFKKLYRWFVPERISVLDLRMKNPPPPPPKKSEDDLKADVLDSVGLDFNNGGFV